MKRIVIIILSLLVAWIVGSAIFQWPPLFHYSGESWSICQNGLRKIDGAKWQYALDNHVPNGVVVEARYIKDYVAGGLVPTCPSGGTYQIGRIGEDPTCSLASQTPPPGVKERVGFFGWRWKIQASSQASHALPTPTVSR